VTWYRSNLLHSVFNAKLAAKNRGIKGIHGKRKQLFIW